MRSYLIFVCLLISCGAKSQVIGSFMPENDLHLDDNKDDFSTMTQAEFNEALDEFEAFYKPLLMSKHKATLVVQRKWSDSTVNAYAAKYGMRWEISMFGGLARRAEMQPRPKDALQIVACHEMGHLVGGFPGTGFTNPMPIRSAMAYDGQADYYATAACAKFLWKDQDEKNQEAAQTIPAYPKRQCDEAHKGAKERNLCYRIMQAGFSLGSLLSSSTCRYDRPDKREVNQTTTVHPAGQCRFDTYSSGSLSSKAFNSGIMPLTEAESAKYVALQSRGEKGFRPRCWFKPTL